MIITINISSLPSGRSLATNSSTLLYPPPSSSYSHKTPPSDHQSSQSLVFPSVSYSPFFPPAQVLTTHHLSRHVLSNSPAFSNSLKHFFITRFVFPTHFLQSSPNPHLKCLQPIHRFLFHDPGFASMLWTIQCNRPYQRVNYPFLKRFAHPIRCLMHYRYSHVFAIPVN